MKKTNTNFENLVATIMTAYGCSREEVLKLIENTSDMSKGAKFARILGYSSDKSEHSELANHLIILNFSYENMKKDDKVTLQNFDLNLVDVTKFNYSSIDLDGQDLETFQNQVRENLQNVLAELITPTTTKKDRENNDEWVNDMLVFNWKTQRLSLIGQGVKKETIVEGDYKKPKSKPKTIARKLIMKMADLRVSKYRRYAIDNLSIVNLQGETLEIQ